MPVVILPAAHGACFHGSDKAGPHHALCVMSVKIKGAEEFGQSDSSFYIYVYNVRRREMHSLSTLEPGIFFNCLVVAEMEWTNQLIFEFLTLYKNEPALWNSANAEHKSKQYTYDSWCRIKT